ncbi:receptor expression-enhancing protein 5-like [Lampris incognitus]|uniref:receptor expression-enhancing protein 5-like n=1 Tax=Lampris incognitus TaxID=2546036 RepID=UPI0024B51881|nr:receptor expression-enhancing protein 5-like [Lampris incognitus]
MLSQLKQRYGELMKERNVVSRLLGTLEEKTGVQKEYISTGIVFFVALYLIFGHGASLLCNLIGFIYPAYCSIKAIESEKKEDDTQWLTYWVIYGLFSIVEAFTDILLSWFPLYFFGKCFFLVWCMVPVALNGSNVLYKNVVRPFFLKHQAAMDEAVADLGGKAKNMADSVAREAANYGLKHEKDQ